jgi:hypothetical protein
VLEVKVFKKDNLNLVLKLIRTIKDLVVDQLFIIVIYNKYKIMIIKCISIILIILILFNINNLI